ncbi:MAG: DUF523 domain-containing protein [Magnetococcales bacterium]|nr:DUF523 domain-containing protein [Magnetococcales bacterium]NGZ07418.1 DUF523 domain-containing protein [Magnetococcales bacterium]
MKRTLAISACLLGHRVRYDGGHKAWPLAEKMVELGVTWIPFCPETECGLGVPREPMRLEGIPEAPTVITIHTRQDHTATLRAWSGQRLTEWGRMAIDGVLWKGRSPSCGLIGVPVYHASGQQQAMGQGIFARACQGCFPHLPMTEADRLPEWQAVTAWIRSW